MIRRFALLQTFVAVARAGKMKQAAQDLALTPGAVSQRIRQLEEVAGRRLVARTPRGVVAEPRGGGHVPRTRRAVSRDRGRRSRTRRTVIAPRNSEYDAVIRGDLAGGEARDVCNVLSGY